MVTFKEARKLAKEITSHKIPILRTLHNWRLDDLLSDPIDFKNDGNGRIGFYPDYLPIEIASNVEMKKDYKMSEIKEARKEFIKEAQPKIKNGNIVILDHNFIGEYNRQEEKLIKKIQFAKDSKESDKLMKKLDKISTKKELLKSYLQTWMKKQLIFQEVLDNEEIKSK